MTKVLSKTMVPEPVMGLVRAAEKERRGTLASAPGIPANQDIFIITLSLAARHHMHANTTFNKLFEALHHPS